MKLVYLIILLIMSGPNLLAQTIGDTALFKIEEQVFYLSSVNKSFSSLDVFRCLKKQSVLMTSLKLSEQDYEVLRPLVSDYKVLRRRQDQLHKIVLLNKILMFSTSVNVSVKENDLQRIGFFKCHKQGKIMSNTLKLLVRAEFLLRDRFLRERDHLVLNENLFEKLRIFYSGINRKLTEQVYFR